jgi:hypothetical protein
MHLNELASVLFAGSQLPCVPILLKLGRLGAAEELHRLGMLSPLVLDADIVVGKVIIQALRPKPTRTGLVNCPLPGVGVLHLPQELHLRHQPLSDPGNFCLVPGNIFGFSDEFSASFP